MPEKETKRPDALGVLEISVTPRIGFTADDVKRYTELGVDRLIPNSASRTADELVDFLSRTAEMVAGAVGMG